MNCTDDHLAQQLAAAAQALQNGDTAVAQQALREAGATLQQRAQEGAAAQQANQAANALGEGRQSVAQAGGQPANPDNLLSENDGRAEPNDSLSQPQPGRLRGTAQRNPHRIQQRNQHRALHPGFRRRPQRRQ